MKTLLSLAVSVAVWFGTAFAFECMWLLFVTWIPALGIYLILETETDDL